MSRPETANAEPWYRQFWPWFLILLPMLAVVGGIVTIYVATSSPHSMVVDDYARIGLATHRKLERDRQAADLGMRADLDLAADAAEIRVRLSGGASRPDHLLLRLSHPTVSSLDQALTLPGYGEIYSARLALPLTGRWYVQLEPPDGNWRLAGELDEGARNLSLVPATGDR